MEKRLTMQKPWALADAIRFGYRVEGDDCELCGCEAPTRPWRVEGVVVRLCATCAEGERRMRQRGCTGYGRER